jgi:hypothetical protein
MKRVAIGVHLRREDIQPAAEAVPIGSLFFSALAVAEEQSLSDRDLLLRVAETRARLLEQATFIAIRYGFAFRTEAEAVARCAPHIERWRDVLIENRNHVELTLKAAAKSTVARPDRHDFQSGAEYLRALHASKDAAVMDPAFRAAVDELIVPLAVRHRWSTRDASSVELAALIERSRLEDASRAGEELKKRCPDVPFLLSGPWPLEVFADADL